MTSQRPSSLDGAGIVGAGGREVGGAFVVVGGLTSVLLVVSEATGTLTAVSAAVV